MPQLPGWTNDLDTLPDGGIAVIGTFSGTVTFGLGEPNQTILTAQGVVDIFVARLNIDGTLRWAKTRERLSGELRNLGHEIGAQRVLTFDVPKARCGQLQGSSAESLIARGCPSRRAQGRGGARAPRSTCLQGQLTSGASRRRR